MPDVLQINDNDTACYWVFDPKDFGCIPEYLDIGGNFCFNKNSNYEVSVNSKNICSNYPQEIHEKGVEQAENITKRNKINNKPEQKYKGFLTAKIENIRTISYKEHNLDVMHAPITNNNMHCNIVLRFPNKKPSPSIRNQIREDLKGYFGNKIEKPNPTKRST